MNTLHEWKRVIVDGKNATAHFSRRSVCLSVSPTVKYLRVPMTRRSGDPKTMFLHRRQTCINDRHASICLFIFAYTSRLYGA